MISKTTIRNPSKMADHVMDTSKTAEYYAGEDVPSQWRGKGAAIQGLEGAVSKEDLCAQLEGRVTDSTGERQLGRGTGDGKTDRRAGWDFTFSSPKSVSVQAEIFGDNTALEAHRAANEAIVDYMERYGAQARVKGATVATGNLTIGSFEHAESRRLDPDLHTHNVIANTTFVDGKAYALSNEKLFAARATMDVIAKAEEAYRLQRAGIACTFDGKGNAEIAHYGTDDLKQFSKGSKEVEAELAGKGLERASASWGDKQDANAATREKKAHVETREQARERWQEEAKAYGVTAATRDEKLAREFCALDSAAEADKSVRDAIEHLSEREYVFREIDLHRQTAIAGMGRHSWKDAEKAIERAIESGALIHDPKTDKYTTEKALNEERAANEMLEAGTHAHEAVMTGAEFDEALAAFEARKSAELGIDFVMKPEQRAASRAVLTGDDRFQGVQGLPGTGKTTMMEFWREAAESKGWKIIGHSNGASQAQKMEQESGIKTTTTAAHLNGQTREGFTRGTGAPRKEIRIMDEASMAGQRDFNRVAASTAASGAKTVFVGDKRQHQSVEAGTAFEHAQKHMPTAELGAASVSRQKTDQAIAVAQAAIGRKYDEAMAKADVREIRAAQDRLAAENPNASHSQKRRAEIEDNQATIDAIAGDFAKQPKAARADTMVVTSTNADRQAINEAVRDAMKRNGSLGEGVQVTTLGKQDRTNVEARRAASFRVGDTLEAAATAKRERVTAGERFEVIGVDAAKNTLRVTDAGGRVRELRPDAVKVRGFNREARELGIGEQIRFTDNHTVTDTGGGQHRVINGQRAEVTRVDTELGTVTVRTGGKEFEIAGRNLKADYAYAATSHGSQGWDAKQIWVHHNTAGGAHGDRESFVNDTRAKEEVRLYTQNLAKAQKQAGHELNKTSAHDLEHARKPRVGDRIVTTRDADGTNAKGEPARVTAGERLKVESVAGGTVTASDRHGNRVTFGGTEKGAVADTATRSPGYAASKKRAWEKSLREIGSEAAQGFKQDVDRFKREMREWGREHKKAAAERRGKKIDRNLAKARKNIDKWEKKAKRGIQKRHGNFSFKGHAQKKKVEKIAAKARAKIEAAQAKRQMWKDIRAMQEQARQPQRTPEQQRSKPDRYERGRQQRREKYAAEAAQARRDVAAGGRRADPAESKRARQQRREKYAAEAAQARRDLAAGGRRARPEERAQLADEQQRLAGKARHEAQATQQHEPRAPQGRGAKPEQEQQQQKAPTRRDGPQPQRGSGQEHRPAPSAAREPTPAPQAPRPQPTTNRGPGHGPELR